MEDVARQVLGLLRDDLRSNDISIETDFRDGLSLVHADPTQIQQVILNLVKNAVDAMASIPGTKRLRLATKLAENSSVVFSVQDSGGGIPNENQEHIFDAFFTSKPEGMGLGLDALGRAETVPFGRVCGLSEHHSRHAEHLVSGRLSSMLADEAALAPMGCWPRA